MRLTSFWGWQKALQLYVFKLNMWVLHVPFYSGTASTALGVASVHIIASSLQSLFETAHCERSFITRALAAQMPCDTNLTRVSCCGIARRTACDLEPATLLVNDPVRAMCHAAHSIE
jgi:hypothetical protein